MTSDHFFFFYWYGDHRDLHSFPTRRSSDLRSAGRPARAHRHRPPRRGGPHPATPADRRSEEHTSELQSQFHLVCRLLREKKAHTPIATLPRLLIDLYSSVWTGRRNVGDLER